MDEERASDAGREGYGCMLRRFICFTGDSRRTRAGCQSVCGPSVIVQQEIGVDWTSDLATGAVLDGRGRTPAVASLLVAHAAQAGHQLDE